MHKHKDLTDSESLLIKILNKHEITHKRIPPSTIEGKKTPDFEVYIDSIKTIWEVKQINANENEMLDNAGSHTATYSIESTKRLNSDIRDALKKFKSFGAENSPCIIAIMDNRDFIFQDPILHDLIMTILCGRSHFIALNDGTLTELHKDSSRISDAPHVSAIAIIYKTTEEIAFLHNPSAKFPLNKEPFTSIFKHYHHESTKPNSTHWE